MLLRSRIVRPPSLLGRVRRSCWDRSSRGRGGGVVVSPFRRTSSSLAERQRQRFFSTSLTTAAVSFPDPTDVVFVSSVWPEPHASAAGVRTEWLLELLRTSGGVRNLFYLSVSSAAKTTSDAVDNHNKSANTKPPSNAVQARTATLSRLQQTLGVQFHSILPNQSHTMQQWIQTHLSSSKAHILVIFDRFYVEEMFSFHFVEHLPRDCTTLVLDMQDWHSLRRARQKCVEEQGLGQEAADADSETDPQPHRLVRPEVLSSAALPQLNDAYALRELASLERCDLTLVCSKVEHELLLKTYPTTISDWKLCTAPLLWNKSRHKENDLPAWNDRQDLVFVGNFRHPPNVDAVQQLRRLWPQMQQKLPLGTNLHIYGAYSGHATRLYNDKNDTSFQVHGYCHDLTQVLTTSRLLVAPLRFGAGLKGKIVEAWGRGGLAVVTTSVGSEGLVVSEKENGTFAGAIADTDEAFVDHVARLYKDEHAWNQAVNGIPSLLEQMNGADQVLEQLSNAVWNIKERRALDTTQALLWHTSQQHTKYFSKYLECKAQLKALQQEQQAHREDGDEEITPRNKSGGQ